MGSILAGLANYKTAIAGIGAALTAGGHLLTHLSTGDTSTIATDVPLIIAGIGLVFGADAAKK